MTSPKLFSQMITSGFAFFLGAHSLLPQDQSAIDSISTRIIINSYGVAGATEEAIRHSLRSRGPADSAGISRDAYTAWKLRWRWSTPHNGMVDLNSARIAVEVEMFVPRAEITSARWSEYHLNLLRHEFNHVNHAIAGAYQLLNEYRRVGSQGLVPLAEAQRISDAAVEKIRMADRSYDSDTDHGRSEGVRW